MKKNLDDEIKKYWEDPKTVSLMDDNLHELEIKTIQTYLKPTDFLIDAGCGDGYATIQYAKKVKDAIGIERSQYLYKKANRNAGNTKNLIIMAGDILEGIHIYNADVVVTQRVLINLSSWEQQKKAVQNIYTSLKPGGRYIMCEDFDDGLLSLNDMRVYMGVKPIEKHWHNLFLNTDKMLAYMKKTGFKLRRHHNFDLYYLLTRVYTPMLGINNPVADEKAKKLQEEWGNNFAIIHPETISPIHVYVFSK